MVMTCDCLGMQYINCQLAYNFCMVFDLFSFRFFFFFFFFAIID